MRFPRKAFVGAGLAVTLCVGGLAFAYFTHAGSGTGSASVGSSSPVTLSATTADTLYPGGATADVTIVVTNPGSGSQHVGDVQLASVAADAAHSTCATSAFSMPDVPVNQTIAAGQNVTVHGVLTMADSGSQDDCQGASLTLNLTSN